jgi:hypothetical protein
MDSAGSGYKPVADTCEDGNKHLNHTKCWECFD